MTGKVSNEKSGVDKETAREFFKPYRIKPVEVYAEPGPGGCTGEKTK